MELGVRVQGFGVEGHSGSENDRSSLESLRAFHSKTSTGKNGTTALLPRPTCPIKSLFP